MPVTNRELSEFMGAAYIPGTFPTVGVSSFMKRSGVNASNATIEKLWDAYYNATTTEKLAPYAKDAPGAVKGALLNSLTKRTSESKNTVAAWLNALADEVAANGRAYYLDPAGAEAAAVGQVDPLNHPLETVKTVFKAAGEAAGAALKPVADPLTNIMKYTAMALVAGAVIYGLWEFTPLFKAKRSRKRNR